MAEIKFTEWTTGRILRHPEFVGLRDDRTGEVSWAEKDKTKKGQTIPNSKLCVGDHRVMG